MPQPKSGWKAAIVGLFLMAFVASAALLGTAEPGGKVSPARSGKATPAASAAQQAGDYAGGDACFACHDIEAAFKKNPHYKNWSDTAKPWSEPGCETCHGAGQAHIDGGTTRRMSPTPQGKPAKLSEKELALAKRMGLTEEQAQGSKARFEKRQAEGRSALGAVGLHVRES